MSVRFSPHSSETWIHIYHWSLTWQYISPSIFSWAQADAIVGGKSTNMTTLLASMMLRKYGDRSNCLNAGCIKTSNVNAWNAQPTVKRTAMLVPNPKNSPSLRRDISPSDLTTFFWSDRWIYFSEAFDANEMLYFSVVFRLSFQIKAADFSPLTSSILTGNTRFVTIVLSFNGDLI